MKKPSTTFTDDELAHWEDGLVRLDEATGMVVGAGPAEAAAPKRKRSKAVPLLVLVLLAAGGTGYYLYSRSYEDTDDAQIDGDISNVSPRVAGTIKSVAVVDNQEVKAGDLLAELDPSDYEVAVQQARATVAVAEAQLRSEDPGVPILQATTEANRTSSQAALAAARKEVAELEAEVVQARARASNAQADLDRAKTLYQQHAIPESQFIAASNASIAAAANVAAVRQGLAAAKERVSQAQSHATEVVTTAPRQLEARRATVVARQAALDLARAQLKQAELNLSYAKIVAPCDGIVGKKSINVGDHVAPGQLLLAISNTSRLWVTANFRETQLRRMKPGMPAKIYVDAIDANLHGTIVSIGGATGSRLSILPPENASGNYVKVVQRVPVRIELAPNQPGMERLRPGMSVEPTVKLP